MYFSIFTLIEVTLNIRLRWLIGAAISQISSVSSTILRLAPPGMQPPSVIQFNASNVPVYLGDVARVSNSFAVQNNMVHVNGRRAAYLVLLKHADASTLAVVDTVSIRLLFIVGTDFFQTVDAGLMKLHLRAPPGTRIEQTEQLVAQVEKRIRKVIPTAEIQTVNDMGGCGQIPCRESWYEPA